MYRQLLDSKRIVQVISVEQGGGEVPAPSVQNYGAIQGTARETLDRETLEMVLS